MRLWQATQRDARALSELAQETYTDAFGASMSADDLRAHLERNLSAENLERMLGVDTFFVAKHEGQLIGYVQFGKCNPSTEFGTSFEQANAQTDYELKRLYVLREYQNQNIGSQLMNAALEHPLMKNAPRIFLDVWEHNHGAHRLYQRFGFQVVGARKFEVASGGETSADLVMCLTRKNLT